MADITLKEPIDITLGEIGKDIDNISDILNNIYKAIMTLNETKWNTKEKKKVEEEFIPYLKKISTDYPLYMKKRLVFAKNAVEKYKEQNIIIEKAADKLQS